MTIQERNQISTEIDEHQARIEDTARAVAFAEHLRTAVIPPHFCPFCPVASARVVLSDPNEFVVVKVTR